jgi:hypothetical protein
MTNLKDKKVLVIDTGGEYTAFAQRLARDYECVYYCVIWQASFPKWNKYAIGLGVEEITRVDSMWEVIDDVDIVCIPDLYLGSLADWLRDRNYKVWGSGVGENIEIMRDEFFEMQQELGIPTSKYEKIKGITKLRKHLKDKENKWIKTNLIRGNGETFHYINSRLSESRLDEMTHTLGAYKDEAIFLVCDPIDNAIEVGHDTMTASGLYPTKVMYGIELKDAAYCSKVIDYQQLPKVLIDIDKKMSSFFKETTYNGFYCTEVRWQGTKGYWGDATMRLGQPPSDLQEEVYDNFSEIIFELANGRVPEIKASKKYGAQIIIKSSLATTEPQAIYFPESIKNNVKIKHLMVKDGISYFIPTDVEMEEIGSVVCSGSSLKEAIENVKKIAEKVEGDCVHINVDAFNEIQDCLNKFKKYNLPTI